MSSRSIRMAADSTQCEARAAKKRKKTENLYRTNKKQRKASARKGKAEKKKRKSSGAASAEEEASECESDLDLERTLKPIGGYLSHRHEMVQHMFRSIRGSKLTAMLPEILKPIALDDLKRMCVEQLEVMSKKRIRRILHGADPETISSSGTEESSDSEDDDREVAKPVSATDFGRDTGAGGAGAGAGAGCRASAQIARKQAVDSTSQADEAEQAEFADAAIQLFSDGGGAVAEHSDAEYHSEGAEYHSEAAEYHSEGAEYHSECGEYHSEGAEYHSEGGEYHSEGVEYHSEAAEDQAEGYDSEASCTTDDSDANTEQDSDAQYEYYTPSDASEPEEGEVVEHRRRRKKPVDGECTKEADTVAEDAEAITNDPSKSSQDGEMAEAEDHCGSQDGEMAEAEGGAEGQMTATAEAKDHGVPQDGEMAETEGGTGGQVDDQMAATAEAQDKADDTPEERTLTVCYAESAGESPHGEANGSNMAFRQTSYMAVSEEEKMPDENNSCTFSDLEQSAKSPYGVTEVSDGEQCSAEVSDGKQHEEPDGEPVGAEEPDNEPLGAEKPDGEPLGAEEPDGEPVGAEEPNGEPLGAEKPDGEPLGAEESDGEPLGAEEPDNEPLGAEEPDGETLGAEELDGALCAVEPGGEPLGAAEPDGETLGAEEHDGAPLGAEEPDGEPLGAEEHDGAPLGAEEPGGAPLSGEEPDGEKHDTTDGEQKYKECGGEQPQENISAEADDAEICNTCSGIKVSIVACEAEDAAATDDGTLKAVIVSSSLVSPGQNKHNAEEGCGSKNNSNKEEVMEIVLESTEDFAEEFPEVVDKGKKTAVAKHKHHGRKDRGRGRDRDRDRDRLSRKDHDHSHGDRHDRQSERSRSEVQPPSQEKLREREKRSKPNRTKTTESKEVNQHVENSKEKGTEEKPAVKDPDQATLSYKPRKIKLPSKPKVVCPENVVPLKKEPVQKQSFNDAAIEEADNRHIVSSDIVAKAEVVEWVKGKVESKVEYLMAVKGAATANTTETRDVVVQPNNIQIKVKQSPPACSAKPAQKRRSSDISNIEKKTPDQTSPPPTKQHYQQAKSVLSDAIKGHSLHSVNDRHDSHGFTKHGPKSVCSQEKPTAASVSVFNQAVVTAEVKSPGVKFSAVDKRQVVHETSTRHVEVVPKQVLDHTKVAPKQELKHAKVVPKHCTKEKVERTVMKTRVVSSSSATCSKHNPTSGVTVEGSQPLLTQTQREILELEMRARAIKAMLLAQEQHEHTSQQ